MRTATAAALILAFGGMLNAQVFRELHEWSGPAYGSPTNDSLVAGPDGRLYGTTAYGGAYDGGTVFAIEADGSGFVTIRSLNPDEDGKNPFANLLLGADGRLYGATSGGNDQAGTLFALNLDGTGFVVLHTFNGTDGFAPIGGLIQGADGRLYGTTTRGGVGDSGAVFAINTDGTGHTVLHSFLGGDGREPQARLVQATNGRLYGTTYSGGWFFQGVIFSLLPDGSDFTVLRYCESSNGGSGPRSGLTQTPDGRLHGTLESGGPLNAGTSYSINPDGSDFRVTHSFDFFGGLEGGYPSSNLILGSNGRLFGSTRNPNAIFSLAADGSDFAVLHQLTSPEDGEGFAKTPCLVADPDGRIYGTTHSGGTNNQGTLFALESDGSDFTVIHDFGNRRNADGSDPRNGVVEGTDGRFYGATPSNGQYGFGSLYSVRSDGSDFTVLHQFTGGSDGSYPLHVMQGADGRLYGVTYDGGLYGTGTLFAMNTDGSGLNVLHNFSGGNPVSGVVQATDSQLYGMLGDSGAVYAINPDGTGYRTLHNFTSIPSTGGHQPGGMLIEITGGRLAGTTRFGGAFGDGTTFSINKDGTGHTILHNFKETVDGRAPAGVVEGSDGRLYGTALSGGMHAGGTLFGMNTDGSGFAVIRHFNAATDGRYPTTEPTEGLDGRLYGIANRGGLNDLGTLYAVNRVGSSFTVLHHFDSGYPAVYWASRLTRATDGRFYGTSGAGGEYRAGLLFSFSLVPEITSAHSAAGVFGQAFNYTITAINAPVDFDALGLPGGLSVDHASGLVSGSPSETGTFPVVIAATNVHGTGIADLSVGVDPLAVTITLSNLEQTFSGDPKSVTVSTIPVGAPVSLTYDGSPTPPAAVGSYSVVATADGPNYTGEATATLAILPNPALPVITQEPQDAAVIAGKNAIFSVSATSPTPLSYQWFKDGVAIPRATSAQVTIRKVSASDTGSYWVIVSNSEGDVQSRVATLSISTPPAPPVITTQPASTTVSLGATASFSVVASGDGTLGYQWRKDGVSISGANTASLVISNVQAGDAGIYSVVVSNASGSTTSSGATLSIAAPPTITSQPQDVTVKSGRTATFNVKVTGATPLTYQWIKNGSPISGANSATFKITKVTAADAGSYAVIVTNSFGFALSAPAQLTVR